MFNATEIHMIFRWGCMDLLKRVHIKWTEQEGMAKNKSCSGYENDRYNFLGKIFVMNEKGFWKKTFFYTS